MSEQYWNYDNGKWYYTDKAIRGRNYFYDYSFYGIKTYVQIVSGFRNHKLSDKCNCFVPKE